MDFTVDHRFHGDVTIVTVTGEIDVFTTPRLRETLLDLLENGSLHLIMDFSDVAFLDSTGLGVLVGMFHRLRSRQGSMVIAGPSERVRRVFHITQLTKIFTIYDTLDEALQARATGSLH
jgi:anti-sigma B factor antagonist